MGQDILKLKSVKKYFGGIKALDGVDLTLKEGEVHALLGENGAGKSTLIKILTGVLQRTSGEMLLHNERLEMKNPLQARRKGIAAIYQELSLVEDLSIAQNIFLGHEPAEGFLGVTNDKEMIRCTQEYLDSFNIDINPRSKVKELGMGQKRIIEIVKALSINAKILLLDEPTTGMSRKEIDTLFKIIDELKRKKITMIYISHILEEIYSVSDRVTVLRDGINAGTFLIDEVDTNTLVRTMIGREVTEEFPKKSMLTEDTIVFEAKNMQSINMSAPLSFSIKKGEILGITGIIGAGKSELGHAIFGVDPVISGKTYWQGQPIDIQHPKMAKDIGIAMIPEDRKTQGLFLDHTVLNNTIVSYVEKLNEDQIILSKRRISEKALAMIEKMKVKPIDEKIVIKNLSGGNQQKIVIGKWLLGEPQLIIMDEPTRGIDVGTKAEIYRLIQKLAQEGVGILLLTSEFKEICGLCHRVLVLRDGKIVDEIYDKQMDGQRILTKALGG